MTTSALRSDPVPADGAVSSSREAAGMLAELWWLWLVVGIAWIVAALVILQFESASINTIGIIIGTMFVFAGVQQFVLAALTDHLRWLWIVFGVLFVGAGIAAFVNPASTFAGFADMLGFLLLTVGTWWIIQAFVERDANPVWWIGLIAGVLMLIMAFWASGQFFIEKAYTLLVFGGIWALMHGIGDIFRAFQVRSLRDEA